ncbi:MAG: PilN domain-containing protein [Bacteriovoracaceae bacterium]|nr:PilN domain-containing protein [Bacteriovoracaceae bacterium]
MIELNLIEVKTSQLSGIRPLLVLLKSVNWIVVAIAGAGYLGGEWYLDESWNKEREEKEGERDQLAKEVRQLKSDIKKNQDVKDMIIAFNKQAEVLKARSAQIEEIRQLKINPQRILERIARDVPETVWLNSIELLPAKTVSIQGEAVEYRAIGDFMAKLNESKFFDRSLKLKDSSSIDIKVNDLTRRVEKFTIAGNIITYD